MPVLIEVPDVKQDTNRLVRKNSVTKNLHLRVGIKFIDPVYRQEIPSCHFVIEAMLGFHKGWFGALCPCCILNKPRYNLSVELICVSAAALLGFRIHL